jgi:hypothetical protein
MNILKENFFKNRDSFFLKLFLFSSPVLFLLCVIPSLSQAQDTNSTLTVTPGASPVSGPAPAPPTHFVIEPGDGAVHLTWDKMSKAEFYRVYISKDGKNFELENNIPRRMNQRVFFPLENGKTYYYGVVSIGFDGQKSAMVVQSVVPNKTSSQANWMLQLTPYPVPIDKKAYGEWFEKQNFPTVGTPGGIKNPKPQPDPPTHFTIELGDGVVRLTWDPMPRAIGYVLYVSEDGQNFKRQFRMPFHKTSIKFPFLQNGKTYYFGIVCVGPYGRKTKMTIQSVVPSKTSPSIPTVGEK